MFHKDLNFKKQILSMHFIESFIVLVGIQLNNLWLFRVRKIGFNQCESQTQHYKTELLYSAEKEPQFQINLYINIYIHSLYFQYILHLNPECV